MMLAVIAMSGDEVFVTLVSGMLAVATWLGILVRWLRFRRYELPRGAASALLLALPVCLGLVVLILRTMASHDVRDDNRYLAMYALMGAGWIDLAPALFLPGISLRDDFFERRNSSAAIAVVGYMVGSTFCFSGGNIGDGPGWWVVVFCAILANAALTFLWFMADALARIGDHITIDRDPAIALRAAGFFIGAGLILGRAVAGDWTSIEATLGDFAAKAWPALMLAAVFIAAERWARPRYHRDEQAIIGRGIFPAMVHIMIGLAVVLVQGEIK